MMFKQIEYNKLDSVLLVALCALLLVALAYAIGGYFGAPWWLSLGIATGITLIMTLLSYYAGDSMILGMSGARQIQKQDNPQLFNVVEEMCIAGGLPMPRVYIIEDTAPNAFSTGRNPPEAAIAVTSGLLSKLNRDELQGVVAHEMSHVRNYDILFMMMVVVMVGTIVLLSDGFRRVLWYGGGGRRSSRDSGGNEIFLLIALVLAIVAPLLAKLIELAASRRREYLADASAVLLTRNPLGLASALQKIAADPEPLEVANRATQQLYIVNPLKAVEQVDNLLSTHPPIQKRIERLMQMAYQDGSARPGEMPGPAMPATPAMPVAAHSTAPAAAGPLSGMGPAAPVLLPVGLAAAGAAASVSAGPAPPLSRAKYPCPRCQATLTPGTINAQPIQGCRSCGGIWLHEDVLAQAMAQSPDALLAADRKFPNLVGTGWSEVGPKRCPDCGEPLQEKPIQGMEQTKVDVCLNCHGVWFDDGELAALVERSRQQPAPTASA